jgi:hypothetical protein
MVDTVRLLDHFDKDLLKHKIWQTITQGTQ